MTWKQMFTSSIGQKLVMAITGIFLITFLIVHVGLNACIWANDGGKMFNAGANFMGTMIVIRIMEIVLFAGIILHIIQGLILTNANNSKRKVGYQVQYGNRGSKWYSRSMGLLGTLLLLFLIMHIYHFWVPSRFGESVNRPLQEITYPGLHGEAQGPTYHNLFAQMLIVFESPLIVALYVLGCISLAYHLFHGFESAFRTLGVHNNRYSQMLRTIGIGFSIIVCTAFAMMPISMHFGWVH